MLQRFSLLLLLIICLISCDDEYDGGGCEEGYVRQYGANGTSFCAEGFVADKVKEYQTGESYYHQNHGLITLSNDIWVNKHNQIIEP
ncbi:hypothetical protein JQC67_01980 [Aurantibacter crassamenti]|uniref:hypothetical protein n=1 Tax=Aurantibacter crassamenti TaxID=1837375 RepID=UPI00193938ED|nr:hypothetical protein [Aurantibacter crassamenti]MBM1104896.1 hypothetical protein [Aurantibacter crassamenti]